jgi:hypothetical protein
MPTPGDKMKAALTNVYFRFVDHVCYDFQALFACNHFFFFFHNNVYFYMSVEKVKINESAEYLGLTRISLI